MIEYVPGTELSQLIAVESPEYPSEILLPAGCCNLVHLAGATAAEIALAKQEPDTEVTALPDFEQRWSQARARRHIPFGPGGPVS